MALRWSVQFALSRQAKSKSSKAEDTLTKRAFPGLTGQPHRQPPSSERMPSARVSTQSADQSTGSDRSPGPILAPDTASLTASQGPGSRMAQDIAAENEDLIASMQPDEANTFPPLYRRHQGYCSGVLSPLTFGCWSDVYQLKLCS